MTPKKSCTGCAACLSICPVNAIRMVKDNEGFVYPEINEKVCIDCGKCSRVCPVGQNKVHIDEPETYMAYSVDETVRKNSSSGGIFTLLAERVLEKDGIVVGCALTEDCRTAHHVIIENKSDLYRLRGSKYVQSMVEDTLNRVKTELKNGRRVLFSGTPCQIAGLKSFLDKTYNNLLTVDVICHGTPSPLVWEKYVDFREKKANSKTNKVMFRNKVKGWKNYSLSFDFDNGSVYSSSITDDLYLKGFVLNYYLRPSCYNCSFKSQNYYSDITLADFWGINRIFSEENDDKGISLVLLHNSNGKHAFDSIQDFCYSKKVVFDEAIKSNPSYFNSVPNNNIRKHFFHDLEKKKINSVLNKYCGNSFVTKIRRKIYNIFGG